MRPDPLLAPKDSQELRFCLPLSFNVGRAKRCKVLQDVLVTSSSKTRGG